MSRRKVVALAEMLLEELDLCDDRGRLLFPWAIEVELRRMPRRPWHIRRRWGLAIVAGLKEAACEYVAMHEFNYRGVPLTFRMATEGEMVA